jgi:hypothetical protein
MASDEDHARAILRTAAAQVADIALTLDPDAGDHGALADQFEAAGLDDLAKRGLDARTRVPGCE